MNFDITTRDQTDRKTSENRATIEERKCLRTVGKLTGNGQPKKIEGGEKIDSPAVVERDVEGRKNVPPVRVLLHFDDLVQEVVIAPRPSGAHADAG